MDRRRARTGRGGTWDTGKLGHSDRKSTRLNSSHPVALHDALPISADRRVGTLSRHPATAGQRRSGARHPTHQRAAPARTRPGPRLRRGCWPTNGPPASPHRPRRHLGHGKTGSLRSEEHTSELQSPCRPTRRPSDLGGSARWDVEQASRDGGSAPEWSAAPDASARSTGPHPAWAAAPEGVLADEWTAGEPAPAEAAPGTRENWFTQIGRAHV